jgi:hypothetical protein
VTRRRTLVQPTDDGAALASAASALLGALELTEPVRLLGVGATGLVHADAGQLALFEAPEGSRRRSRLNRALDELAHRFGPDTVMRADERRPVRAGLTTQVKRGVDDGAG